MYSPMNFNMCIDLWTAIIVRMQHSLVTSNTLLCCCPSVGTPCPHPGPLTITHLFSVTVVFVFLRISRNLNHTICNFLRLAFFTQQNVFHTWVLIAFFPLCFPVVQKILYRKISCLHREMVISHINAESLSYSKNNMSIYSCLCLFKWHYVLSLLPRYTQSDDVLS